MITKQLTVIRTFVYKTLYIRFCSLLISYVKYEKEKEDKFLKVFERLVLILFQNFLPVT